MRGTRMVVAAVGHARFSHERHTGPATNALGPEIKRL